MTNLKTLITGAALALVALSSFAQIPPAASAPATPGVDQRQANQSKRIEKGVASGQLTPREARRLDKQQASLAVAETNAKADGTVTPQERRRLHKMQDHTSQTIRQQKHDAQGVPKP